MQHNLFRSMLALALTALCSTVGSAQTSDSEVSTMQMSVPSAVYLDLSSPTITIPAVTAANLRSGTTASTSLTLTYGGNTNFVVAFALPVGNDSELVGVNNAANRIHISRIRMALDGAAEEGLPTSRASYITKSRGDYTSTITFRANVDTSVVPDTYATSITWSIGVI